MSNEEHKLHSVIDKILAYGSANLIRRSEWGAINFSDIEGDIERIFKIVGALKIMTLSNLPDNQIKKITSYLDGNNRILTVLENIDKFKLIGHGNRSPEQERDRIIGSLRSASNDFLETAAPWIAFLAYLKGDLDSNISELMAKVKEAESKVDASLSSCQQAQYDIEKIVINAREASASAGAQVYTKDFSKEADKLEIYSKIWLGATISIAIIALVFAIFNIYWSDPIEVSASFGQIFQVLGNKILIVTVLFTASLWCGNNYKALRHQIVDNRHKAHALKTFQAFSAAAADDATRNAVLMETTRCIFSSRPSGFIPAETSGANNPVQIIELLRQTANSANKVKPE